MTELTTVVLTKEERAEFTLLNLCAFINRRAEAQKKNAAIPCWLVTSEESREEARQELVSLISVANFLSTNKTLSREELVEQLDKQRAYLLPALAEWQATELEFKRLRDVENNPQAWFVHPAPAEGEDKL